MPNTTEWGISYDFTTKNTMSANKSNFQDAIEQLYLVTLPDSATADSKEEIRKITHDLAELIFEFIKSGVLYVDKSEEAATSEKVTDNTVNTPVEADLKINEANNLRNIDVVINENNTDKVYNLRIK